MIESAAPGELRAAAFEIARGPVPTLLLAAGGDGTSHEVVSGLFDAGPAAPAAMSWIPLGSGNDLARANRIPLDPRRAVAVCRAGATGRIDVGRVAFRDEAGHRAIRTFGNSFTLGVPGDVLAITTRVGKPAGGRVSYFLAALAALARHRPLALALTADGEPRPPGRYRLVSVTNGPTFGAGMRIAPGAVLDDGMLDLVTVADRSRLSTATIFPAIYWGGHLGFRGVAHRRIRRLEIAGDPDATVPIELDGELTVGKLPMVVTVEGRRVAVVGSRGAGERAAPGPRRPG